MRCFLQLRPVLNSGSHTRCLKYQCEFLVTDLDITNVSSGGLRVTPRWCLFTSSSSTQYLLSLSSIDSQLWPLLLPKWGQESGSGKMSSTCCPRHTRLSSHSPLPSQRRNSCALVILKVAPFLSSPPKDSSHLPLTPRAHSFLVSFAVFSSPDF